MPRVSDGHSSELTFYKERISLMKRCPKCNRAFPDDNQKFCTIDGGLLVADKPFDPNATVQSFAPSKDQPASTQQPDFGATIATSSSAPTVVFPKDTGPTGSPTAANLHQQPKQAPQPSAPPPGTPASAPPRTDSAPLPPQTQSAPVPQAPGPASSAAAAPKKKSKLPLILGILAILLVFGVGAVVAAFFLVIKPRLQPQASEPSVVVTNPQPENVNTNANAPATNSETKPTESEFVAPPNTTKFENSAANLDGKLAEHYVDFSFYYPDNWAPDPKAGVAGSGNFAKVERRLPPDFTQENFAVRWYESKGTYDADLPDFPKQVEDFSASLAKAFPGYRKVSEGPTKINSLDAYEFRWAGLSKGTEKGDLQLWGRVVFVPTGVAGDNNGVILTMFTTSLAPELSSVEDVGAQGEMPVILESFRFGKTK
jgi:flagellar basal body-associated protein FliL